MNDVFSLDCFQVHLRARERRHVPQHVGFDLSMSACLFYVQYSVEDRDGVCVCVYVTNPIPPYTATR